MTRLRFYMDGFGWARCTNGYRTLCLGSLVLLLTWRKQAE